MDTTVKFAGSETWPPSEQTYPDSTFEKVEGFTDPEGQTHEGITVVVYEDENANRELDPGELRAFYPPGTWTDVTQA
jgi:uncharacterized protein YraI